MKKLILSLSLLVSFIFVGAQSIEFESKVVEYGTTESVFSNPQHDYTKTLLQSIPHSDPIGREERKEQRLKLERFSM